MLNFIANPKSAAGKTAKALEKISAYLDNAGVPYRIHRTEHACHATELADKIFREQGPDDIIVIVGGDGSLNEAIQKLPFDKKPLIGYIPVGSGMDFAAGHGIPCDIIEALKRIIDSKEERLIDIGKASADGKDKYFIVSSGIGYDAQVCYDLDQSRIKTLLNKLGLGKLGYFFLGFKDFFTYKKAKTHLEITGYCPITDNGEKPDTDSEAAAVTVKDVSTMAFTSVHNTPYEGGGYPFAPSAKSDDGKLTVCLCAVKMRRTFFTAFLMCKNITGYHLRKKGNEEFHCTKLKLTVDTPLAAHTDGETLGKLSEISFECVPGALRLKC